MISRASLAAVCFAVLAIGSCGGGGGSVPPERPAGNLTGVAYDGHIVNGAVSVYSFDGGTRGELIATTSTDASGFFGLDINPKAGPLLVEVTGGSYTEEASGELVNLVSGQSLQTLVNYQPGSDSHISLTYLTHVAAGLAQYNIGLGRPAAESIDQANALVSAYASFDVVSIEPLDVTEAGSTTGELTDGLRYGFYAAGVSQWTREVNERKDLAPHALYNSIQFAQLAHEDILSDGVLDGLGAGGQQLALGSVLLSPDVYVKQLGLAMARFAQSTRNLTGFGASKLLSTFTPALEASALFGGADVVFVTDGAPQITFLSPADGALVAGTALLKASVFDAVGITQTVLELDGAILAQFATEQSVEHSLDTTALSDGSHTLTVRTQNVLDVVSEASVTFTIRNVGFAFGAVVPPPNSLVSKSFVMTIPMVDPAGIASAVVELENGDLVAIEDVSAPKALVDTAKLADGQREFVVKAKTTDGREEQLSVKYLVDNSVPNLAVTGFDAGQAVQGNLRWSAVASDANGIDRIELWVAGEKTQTWPNATKLNETLDTTVLPDGQASVRFFVYDAAGNSDRQAFDLTVDNQGPVITVSQPVDGAVVSGSSAIKGQITDKVGVANGKIAIGGGSAQVIDKLADFSQAWDSRSFPDGALKIEVTAVDTAGHQATRSVSVTVDNSGPSVDLRSPRAGDVFNRDFTFKADATDPSGIASVTFLLGDREYPAADPSKAEAAVDIAAVADGVYSVSVKAVDGSGAATTTPPVEITLDTAGPELGLETGGAYDSVTRTCEVTLTANDKLSGIAEAKLDGTNFGARSGTWTQSVLLGPNRKETVVFSAKDVAGNETSITRCITSRQVLLGIELCAECP